MALKELLYFLRYPIKSIQNAMGYDELSRQHTENINEKSALLAEQQKTTKEIWGLREKVRELESSISGLAEQRDLLARDLSTTQTRLLDYQKDIKSIPEYKILEEAKEKVEKELADRNMLIDLLKADKQTLIGLSKQIINKIPYFLVESLKEDPEYAKKPCVFIDARGIVIGYTDRIKEEIGNISEELLGESYLRILEEGCACTEKKIIDFSEIKRIRNFFNLDEEKVFDIKLQRENETIEFHIVKKRPVFYRGLESLNLSILAEEIDANKIAYIPLIVERLGGIRKRFYHRHSLDEVIGRTEEEMKLAEEAEKETPEVHKRLVKYHWKSDAILKIENKMGPIQSYLYFKKILYELEAKTEKEKKVERKRAAGERLKKMKISRRRPKNIVKRLTKIGIDNTELMGLINNPEINYQDFRNKCAELVKEYKKKQRENIIETNP